MYAEEDLYTIDVHHLCLASIVTFAMADFEENVEEIVRTTREAADGNRVRRGRDGDETGGPGYETGDKTAATAGDERDGGDRGVMYTNEGELEFYEDEMAALEGQRLVAEFSRYTRWPEQPSIIDPVTNATNVKKAIMCI